MEYLGQSFDIHGGGRDLIFPHHENEIAQSEGATGKPFARYWIHNGFVNINAEKMSKSLGNIRTIAAILDKWDPEVVRYFLLSAHYATPLDFTDKAMEDAESSLSRFYESLARLIDSPDGSQTFDFDFDQYLKEGMDDDFNTAAVIGCLFDFVRQLNAILDKGQGFDRESKKKIIDDIKNLIGGVLGVFGSDPHSFLKRYRQRHLAVSDLSEDKIVELIEERCQARSQKDWARSDAIRDELAAKGIMLKDNPDGTTSWSVKTG
jgi:cysteinyl-tRNA synthetase